MCFFNESSTILLLLLTILLVTMPTITTTTSSSSSTSTLQMPVAGSALGARITTDLIGAAGGGGGGGFPQQQQQQQQQQPKEHAAGLHAKSMAFLDRPDVVLPSSGTEFLPASHDDNFIVSLVGPTANHNNGRPHTKGQNHHQNHMLNMDYNGVESRHPDDLEDGEESSSAYPPPVFDFGMPRNITARSGQTAAINCRVENLGDKSVSWIRKRDLHILTAGILTYTSDERFKVVRTPDSKDWTLHVKYAQPRDSGIYECQVNTEPKISMAFRLNVIVTPPDAKAIITGPTDLYVKVGSAITLTCHVKQPSSSQDIGPIYWYRGPYILTPFVAHPNDAAIDLQRISMESKLGEKLQSRLRIANAQTADSGNYTCMPTTADAASVMVNVINDESPAAMQKSSAHRPLIGMLPLLAPIVGVLHQLHRLMRPARNYSARIIVTYIIAISAAAVRWLWSTGGLQRGHPECTSIARLIDDKEALKADQIRVGILNDTRNRFKMHHHQPNENFRLHSSTISRQRLKDDSHIMKAKKCIFYLVIACILNNTLS